LFLSLYLFGKYSPSGSRAGYFIHFGTASMVLQVGRAIRGKLRDRVIAMGALPKQCYDFLGFFFIKFFMGYSMRSLHRMSLLVIFYGFCYCYSLFSIFVLFM
jgi:hypothetical protein